MVTSFVSSQLPVASLRRHRCVLLVWLPFPVCLRLVEAKCGTDLLTNTSHSICTTTTSSTKIISHTHNDSEGPFDNMSGFEHRLFQTVTEESFMPMHALCGVFPDASEYYREDAALEISVHLANNVTALSTSPWVHLEAHREVAALVVVINCHEIEPRRAVSAVKLAVHRYFSEKTTWCCVLLDPPKEIQQELVSPNVFVAHTNTPVKVVSRHLLREISLSVVHHINTCLVAINLPSMSRHNSVAAAAASVQKASETSSDSTLTVCTSAHASTPGSTVSANLVGIADSSSHKKHALNSRSAKRKGDVLLQLGALDAALVAYTESLANVDPLLTSATLESIAAVRYMQNSSLFALKSTAEDFFSSIESGETTWNDAFAATLDRIESVTATTRTEQHKVSALLRSHPSVAALGKKLLKEVDEPLAQHWESLRRLITAIRNAIAPEPQHSHNFPHNPLNSPSLPATPVANATPAVNLDTVGTNVRNVFHLVLAVSYHELQLYLQEALHQLRGAPGGLAGVHDRAADVLLKRTELFASEGNRVNFVKSLSQLKEAVRLLPDAPQWNMRGLYPGLCVLCGCERKGVLYTLEMAAVRRQARNFAAAIRLQARACRMAGIPLPLIEMRGEVDLSSDQGVITQRSAVDHGDFSDREKETGVRRARMQDVPLLMGLLDILVEAGVCGGPQSTVASLLLFEYYPFLDRETQQSLMDVIEHYTGQQESVALTPPPLLTSMDVLALPPHLAPKTVPLSGAQFTFIDMSRLRMTVLTLNGNILPHGQAVWCEGDVGEVEITLTNPFLRDLQLTSIALSCRSVSRLDVNGKVPNDEAGHIAGPFAPSSYVVTGVILPSLSKRKLRLQVQPNIQGYLIIEGVDIRLGQLFTCSFLVPSPMPILIPVIQQLPLVSCTLGVSEVEIFAGQTQNFPLRVTNAGAIALRRLQITAHDGSCQLEGCTGCKERPGSTELYVSLERDPVLCNETLCLEPGDTHNVCVTMIAPSSIDNVAFQHIVFRATVEVPHDKPVAPDNVASAVPVFAVIPRRIQETYLRVFHVPSIDVTSLKLSRDQRCVEITVKNKSRVHTTELLCSHMFFANIPDVLVVPDADFLIPPIEITRIPQNMRKFSLPWVVRELPACRGVLMLDFSVIAEAVVCTQPLEDASVSVSLHEDSDERCCVRKQLWTNGLGGSKGPLVTAALRPVLLTVSVSAPWKSAVPIRIRLESDSYLDADVLSGPVDVTVPIGSNGQLRYEEVMEYYAFKTGDHTITIRLSDQEGREMSHTVGLQVQHF